jgi:hypothetical protein
MVAIEGLGAVTYNFGVAHRQISVGGTRPVRYYQLATAGRMSRYQKEVAPVILAHLKSRE